MAEQSDGGTLAFVELLSVGEGVLSDPDRSFETPIVLLTVRPEPNETFQSFSFAVSRTQAERLRDDLASLLDRSQSPTLLN